MLTGNVVSLLNVEVTADCLNFASCLAQLYTQFIQAGADQSLFTVKTEDIPSQSPG